MPRRIFGVLLILLSSSVFAAPSTDLSLQERQEVEQRISKFYSSSFNDPSPLFTKIPKFSINHQGWSHRNQFLRLKTKATSPLQELAQGKMTDGYEKAYCEKILKRYFPEIYEAQCETGSWSSYTGNDDIETLAQGWIARGQVKYDMDVLPTTGKSAQSLWSDDYWRTRWGLTSYRYATPVQYKTYKEAVAAYAQPKEWLGLSDVAVGDLEAKTAVWSPAEKYDLSVGDNTFQMTLEQKNEGKGSIGDDGNVEDWMEICHGWTAATTMVPSPVKDTKITGLKGGTVHWYPADVRAMVSLHWANANYRTNFIGGRCETKKVETYPNGRIKNQNCFDTNPATFHLAMANMIGIGKNSLVMNKNFDYEIWNQPIESYEFTFFNPLDPSKKSKDWKEVAVDYDRAFKSKDRFQKPLTRGKKKARRGFDDSNIEKIVGVTATVVYLVELDPPTAAPQPDENQYERVTYVYDLELEKDEGVYYPAGGEWYQNAHPDFLWVPRKSDFAVSDHDNASFAFDGESQPAAALVEAAQSASPDAYPLCRVMKELVKRSTGKDVYRCPDSE